MGAAVAAAGHHERVMDGLLRDVVHEVLRLLVSRQAPPEVEPLFEAEVEEDGPAVSQRGP
jgi:hypothetical protein